MNRVTCQSSQKRYFVFSTVDENPGCHMYDVIQVDKGLTDITPKLITSLLKVHEYGNIEFNSNEHIDEDDTEVYFNGIVKYYPEFTFRLTEVEII